MDLHKLFIKRLDDLHLSINSGDEYNVICASGIIRQLFLDGGASLVDQVNLEYKEKLNFRVIEPKFSKKDSPYPNEIVCAFCEFDPRRSTNANNIIDLKQDSFLSLKVGRSHGVYYSIKDIIKFAANSAGGVHKEKSGNKKDIDLILEELQKQYPFPDKNILLLQLRSIGRIILEGLRPLRDTVLKLERFKGEPGLSIHIVITLHPIEGEKELYILDVGVEENKDRLSIYLDGRQELCFRLIDKFGQAQTVRAGSHDCAFNFGTASYLAFDMAFHKEEVLLQIDMGGWSMVKIIPSERIGLKPENTFYVLGSDVKGASQTHMNLWEMCIASCHPTEQQSEKLIRYYDDKMQQGYTVSLFAKGNQFMHSNNHPNFTKTN
ncbi:MAG: hypothetical protein ACI9UO_001393 [Nitrospinales bacterium]|jgi:hypothetical protein